MSYSIQQLDSSIDLFAPPVPTSIPTYISTKDDQAKQKADNVVHITITESGTVVYTHTATSYSYIPTYSTVSTIPNNDPTSSSRKPNNNSNTNTGAIIGGAVGGGVALIALVGLLFLLLCRHRRRHSHLYGKAYAIDNESNIKYSCAEPNASGSANPLNNGLVPRQLIAPLQGVADEPNIRESKYVGNVFYEDTSDPSYNNLYTKPYFALNNTTDSMNSDSSSSTTVEGNTILPSYDISRHVPNEIDPILDRPSQERHVPHLKD
ncbi:hypothetical protein RMCBS344292_04188 [Rhizopus microsporus]|nr:hypothetical protein RMCBS344292_04188 [Rhizopus microsporus]